MQAPLAYFLTWTTYGTHLRGHRSGSIDHKRAGRGNRPIAPSPLLESQDEQRSRHPAFTLSDRARAIVADAVMKRAEFAGWSVLALQVRTNHVHVLVRADEAPGVVMTSFKAWATRVLRESGLVEPERKIWTRHGSTRWINDAGSLGKARQYIVEFQEGPAARRRYGKGEGGFVQGGDD